MENEVRQQAGFTLIEVLVALTIAGFAMVAVMQLMGTTLDGSEKAARASTALLIAESRLAAVGVETPLRTSRSTGVAPDGYHWRVEVRPYNGLPAHTAEQVPLRAFEVAVSVVWAPRREVSLTALRLLPRETAGDRP